MKIDKVILAAALGLGLAGYSYADDIYLTGSTAMRGNVFNTLSAANSVFSGTPQVTTWAPGTGSGATYMDFVGTLKGGSGTTTIHCDWSGSEAGLQNTAGRVEAVFSADAPNGQQNASSPSTTVNSGVDVSMADNAQAFSRTPSPVLTGAKVGVITFKWVRNNGVWTGTNITDAQIQQALGGYCPIGVVNTSTSGSTNNDSTSYVYVSGRDDLSGTRVNAFGLTGYGIFNPPNQIELDGSGNMVEVGGAGSGIYEGDYGFSSGGTLAASLTGSTATSTDQINGGTGFSVLAYLGYSDAATAIGDGCTELTYDGVAFSIPAIEEGNYNYWGNEYIYEAPSADWNSTQVGTLFSDMVSAIPNYCYPNNGASAAAISVGVMNCQRSGPLSPPGHN